MEQFLIISSVLLWAVVLLNLLLTLALIRRSNANGSIHIGLKVGTRAPDFTAETLRGEPISLDAYIGRSVAFLFISAHCHPCRDLLPRIQALWPTAKRAGVELVLVSADDKAQTQALVDELNIHMPIVSAPRTSNPFANDYKIAGTPYYCLIDAQARVQSVGYPNVETGEWKTLAESWETSTTQVAGLVPSTRG